MADAKVKSLERDRLRFQDGDVIATNQGLPIADDKNSLKAGIRGPILMEDFILREKIQHFDHERIRERVVHANGAAAHGYFQVYKPLSHLTSASLFQDPSKKTPLFARFSTVVGSKGSADTGRDVRGFAVKFYTDEGIWDFVGNSMPAFFVQDAMKFVDFIHAVKPEPDREIPTAGSFHDTLWDFITNQPESTHMIMWLMSDRALPRAYANMQGFGVHTFRMVNAEGVARFVKFHWKPVLGVCSLLFDEATTIAGKESDFNKKELWESIEAGNFPEWELAIQVIEETDEHKFPFDLLDDTKIIPEEMVPLQVIGKMTLNRNPDNYFAETEQVAFCLSHIVPGLDFTNDPMLQARLFSYKDTQLGRLGGPNNHEIPINRPLCPFQINGQRGGAHRTAINCGKTSYHINAMSHGTPKEDKRGFVTYAERIDGAKIRQRSPSFADHFSQATLFWKSMSPPEQEHIISAFTFDLSKVKDIKIRQRMVNQLQNVDLVLSQRIGNNLGLKATEPPMKGFPSDLYAPSPALSQDYPGLTPKNSVKGRKIAILAADGADVDSIHTIQKVLKKHGAEAKVLSLGLGKVGSVEVEGLILAYPSVLFDAVYVPGGAESVRALMKDGPALHFVGEFYKHCKPIAVSGQGVSLLKAAGVLADVDQEGVIIGQEDGVSNEFVDQFMEAIKQHRFFSREE